MTSDFRSAANSKPRGKSALDIEHQNISEEDERKIDLRICTLYGVNAEEAGEIHANYHMERIFTLLKVRARRRGMTESTYLELLQDLDLHYYATLVSKGRLIENAAVDVLYRGLVSSKSGPNFSGDRYNSFYG